MGFFLVVLRWVLDCGFRVWVLAAGVQLVCLFGGGRANPTRANQQLYIVSLKLQFFACTAPSKEPGCMSTNICNGCRLQDKMKLRNDQSFGGLQALHVIVSRRGRKGAPTKPG